MSPSPSELSETRVLWINLVSQIPLRPNPYLLCGSGSHPSCNPVSDCTSTPALFIPNQPANSPTLQARSFESGRQATGTQPQVQGSGWHNYERKKRLARPPCPFPHPGKSRGGTDGFTFWKRLPQGEDLRRKEKSDNLKASCLNQSSQASRTSIKCNLHLAQSKGPSTVANECSLLHMQNIIWPLKRVQ